MNILIAAILFVAYSAAMFFVGFQQNEKRHAAAEAQRIAASDRIITKTRTINRVVHDLKIVERQVQPELARKVEDEIKATPAKPGCDVRTGLLNTYISRANAAGRLHGPDQGADAPAGPSH